MRQLKDLGLIIAYELHGFREQLQVLAYIAEKIIEQ